MNVLIHSNMKTSVEPQLEHIELWILDVFKSKESPGVLLTASQLGEGDLGYLVMSIVCACKKGYLASKYMLWLKTCD